MDEDKNKTESASERIEREKREREEKLKRLEAEYLEDLKTNPCYKEFFSQYTQKSVDSFIQRYASHKASLVVYGHYYVEELEGYISKHYTAAEEMIWDIQQRKLYDLQIKWRAEQVKIPEIEISKEFDYWEDHIKSCPFLEPITRDELDLYISYLEYSCYDDIFYWDLYRRDFQDYEEFKKHYFYLERHEEYYRDPPPWYEFYESRTGLSALYLLPDLRGEKEKFYFRLYRENKKKEEEAKGKKKPAPVVNHVNREIISTDLNFILEFAKKYEDGDTFQKFIGYKRQVEMNNDDDLTDAIRTLQSADRLMPIDYNKKWKDGIIEAAHNYEKIKLIEEMPKVYADYLFRLSTGISFEEEVKELRDSYLGKYIDEEKAEILEGRMLNGEPPDFNF